MNALEQELKHLLIEVLNLEDITVEQIDSEAPLFGDGLGLDSIDALELGVAIRRKYGVRMDGDAKAMRDALRVDCESRSFRERRGHRPLGCGRRASPAKATGVGCAPDCPSSSPARSCSIRC